MQLSCPKCGAREVRLSHRQGIKERLKGLIGVSQLRCRRCRHRWETSAWASGAWHYARCPRCYRQELTTWSEHYYNPAKWTVMLLRLGATPYRCTACRCNFASFKACKEQFTWRHQTLAQPATPQIERPPGPVQSALKHQPSPRPTESEEPML